MSPEVASAWVLDLDGVIWLAGRPIAGAADAVQRLRDRGIRVMFITNNSGLVVADVLATLSRAGVPAEPGELLTSAHAAAQLVEPGARVAMVGDAGIAEALAERGVVMVGPTDRPDAVVVGRTKDLDYDQLASMATAIRDGARFVATNTDATFPTPDGPVPGAGALVAFLQVASGVEPEVAGKPHPPAARLVAERLGKVAVVVGDRPDTDGRFAKAVDARFVLVLSGVTNEADLPVTPEPDAVVADLAAAVDGAEPGRGANEANPG